MRSNSLACLVVAAFLLAIPAAGQPLFETADGPLGIPDDFTPPGTLYDNDVSDGITSLVGQDSDGGAFFARTADDFILDGAGCTSGQFEITSVRVQSTQQNATPQPWGLDFFNGDAAGPAPNNASVPFATLAEDGQMNLGPFGATTSLFEVSFPGGGLILDADTIYWLGPFGTDGAANAGAFNNFFATSVGAVGTVANGFIIAPAAGVPVWTPVDTVIGPPALHFSFAIDGFCLAPATPTIEIPTLGQFGLLAMLLSMLGAGIYRLRRRS